MLAIDQIINLQCKFAIVFRNLKGQIEISVIMIETFIIKLANVKIYFQNVYNIF